jgi:hypothetical protein
MEIRSKVIHVKVSLDDLRPTPRKDVKAECLQRLKFTQVHKPALSLNIPSESSPRLAHLRQNLAKAFHDCETATKAEFKSSKLEKKKPMRNSIDSSAMRISQNPKTSRAKTSALKLNPVASNLKEMKQKVGKYRNIYSLPQSMTGNQKTLQIKKAGLKSG